MAKKRRTSGSNPSKTLRQRAEERTRTLQTDIAEMKADDVQRLVHELQVHQIELELQNEELREAQVALAESRDRYADLYEFAPVGYLSVGPDGVIREANLTAAKLLARERASLIGKRLSHFVARQSQDALFLHWREALQAQERTTCELRMSRPNAPELDVELDIVAHPVDSTTAGAAQIDEVRVTLSDITERRLAEQRLAADLDAMKVLQKLSNRFVQGDKLETLLDEIVETAIACAGADFGTIQLLDPATGDLRIVAQRGFPPWWIHFWNEASKNQGCCGAALKHGKRVIVEDVARDPIFVGTPALDIQLRAGVRAIQSTPLVSRSGRQLAMLSTHYRTPHRPDERVLTLLDLSARQAADLIERVQVEATLREHEERWKFALQATDVGAWKLDLVDHTAWRSLRHDQIFGYDQLLPEWTYEMFLEHVLEEDRARVDQSFQQALAQHQDWDIECRIRCADGQIRWIRMQGRGVPDTQGQLVQMFGLVQDITEPKRAEETLLDLNENLETQVAERTAAVAMLCDVASMANIATDVEAAIEYALERVSEYDGWRCGHAWLVADDNPDELLPECVWYEESPARFDKLHDRISVSRLKRGDGLVGRVFASGKPEFTNDIGAHLTLYKASLADHVGIQTACAFPVFAGEEQVVGVIEFFAEKHIAPTEQRLAYMASAGTQLGRVIERKQTEQARCELNETLRQRARDLRRLATQLTLAEQHERSRLAKLLHDDLQQLLVAASLRLSSLAEGGQNERKQNFAMIDALLQDCQMISRDLSHELSPPILKHGTLADVVAWLAEWFGEKHGLTVAVDAPNVVPAASEHLRVFIFQAARELLFNAVKHSGSTAARVILSCQDNNLSVQVEDGGICFDPQDVEAHLRQPEGFGLFSIRERLRALGGRLEIERTRQGGACCRLVVPLAGGTKLLADSAEPEGVEMATWGDSRSHSVIRLLVVDDHALIREGFVSLLNRQPNLEVVGEAADGAEAIQKAGELRPDVVLMDVYMPTMDGVEATRRLTEQYADIAVIALSVHEGASLSRVMTAAGADAFLSKRAATKDLVETIYRVCLGSAKTSG